MNLQHINWPALRVGLYSLAGGVVACLGAVGVIAPDRVDGLTQVATAVVGGLVAILAAANVGKKPPMVEARLTETPAPTVVVAPPAAAVPTPASSDLSAEAARWAAPDTGRHAA